MLEPLLLELAPAAVLAGADEDELLLEVELDAFNPGGVAGIVCVISPDVGSRMIAGAWP